MASTPRRRLAVTSDQSLVAEAIGAALSDRGFDTLILRWPTPGGEPVSLPEPRRDTTPSDVALMLSDLDRPAQVRGAVQLMGRLPVPWVVLAGVDRGPTWGALLEIGAEVVAPITTSLTEVVDILGGVAEGRSAMSIRERRELTSAWRDLRAHQADLTTRVASMTPRETQVLGLLYAGTAVRLIAAQLGVSEATVRSQVKQVLRKLEVKSQLAAVAAFDNATHV